MNTKESVMEHYANLGFVVEWTSDVHGMAYDFNRHDRAFLYTLDGTALLYREGRPTTRLLPGVVAVIEAGQIHDAVVGEDGWEFIAAFDSNKNVLAGD